MFSVFAMPYFLSVIIYHFHSFCHKVMFVYLISVIGTVIDTGDNSADISLKGRVYYLNCNK